MRLRNVKNKEEILKKSKYIIENPQNYKGKWYKVFSNNNPIHLEVGTGKCKFIKEMALKYPDINFIGLERAQSVLALGVKKIEEDIPNLRLISYDAGEIEEIFDNEISVIYLNFSDPWPKDRHAKRRLTHEVFLKKYDKVFKDKKIIIQKTDNMHLFEFSIISLSNYGYVIKEINLDLQNSENNDNIMTEYEIKFAGLGQNIYMLKAEKNI